MIELSIEESLRRDELNKADYRLELAKEKLSSRVVDIHGEGHISVKRVIAMLRDGVKTSRVTEIIACLEKTV